MTARTVTADDGTVTGFDHLVLATGARAVPAPWANTTRVHSIRTFDDACVLAGVISGGANTFLVVGGGYLGLETASTLTGLGLDVTLVEASPALLTGRASVFAAGWLQDRHQQLGLKLHLGSLVVELSEDDGGVDIRLANGTEVRVDQVIFAVGAIANLDLAKQIGLEHGRGVFVDAAGRTSVPGVYAIGDVSSWRTPSGQEARIESVFNATSQAKSLSRLLAGKPPKGPTAPTFWSDQAGISVRLAGWVPAQVETTDVVTQDEDGWFVERYLHGTLVAVEAVNRLPQYLRVVPSITDLRSKL
jgi:3-phenylpropionate/trans-cinnamate dioxygenase ferredoxin reductase subunit